MEFSINLLSATFRVHIISRSNIQTCHLNLVTRNIAVIVPVKDSKRRIRLFWRREEPRDIFHDEVIMTWWLE
jgi:hypothetical protein